VILSMAKPMPEGGRGVNRCRAALACSMRELRFRLTERRGFQP
jgi:hypothetical protein